MELLPNLEETGGRDSLGQEMNLSSENPFQGARRFNIVGLGRGYEDGQTRGFSYEDTAALL